MKLVVQSFKDAADANIARIPKAANDTEGSRLVVRRLENSVAGREYPAESGEGQEFKGRS